MAEGLWPTKLYGLKWYGGKAEVLLRRALGHNHRRQHIGFWFELKIGWRQFMSNGSESMPRMMYRLWHVRIVRFV